MLLILKEEVSSNICDWQIVSSKWGYCLLTPWWNLKVTIFQTKVKWLKTGLDLQASNLVFYAQSTITYKQPSTLCHKLETLLSCLHMTFCKFHTAPVFLVQIKVWQWNLINQGPTAALTALKFRSRLHSGKQEARASDAVGKLGNTKVMTHAARNIAAAPTSWSLQRCTDIWDRKRSM